MTLNYAAEEIPRLLPIHQFVSFETEKIRDRIKCILYKDAEQCLIIEMTRCKLKGETTEAYESCMIELTRAE